jgi:hypothetical protein
LQKNSLFESKVLKNTRLVRTPKEGVQWTSGRAILPEKGVPSMKSAQVKRVVLAMALSLVLAPVGMSSVYAQDGVVKADQQRVDQDKQDLKKANEDAKQAHEKVKSDKASGNKEELKKDREALKEARRNRREAKVRLKKDRESKKHDVKNP